MKSFKTGKLLSGSTIPRVLPRLEFLKASMTIMQIKKYLFSKMYHVFKEGKNRFQSDIELNDLIQIQLYNNLPYIRTG